MDLFSILTIIFVIAKIFNFVDWSWWIVFSPTIVYVIITIFIILLIRTDFFFFRNK